MKTSNIFYIEKNIHGAWIICGVVGMRQYYYYTRRQATDLYLKECRKYNFINE